MTLADYECDIQYSTVAATAKRQSTGTVTPGGLNSILVYRPSIPHDTTAGTRSS